jgi:hypothetical protein
LYSLQEYESEDDEDDGEDSGENDTAKELRDWLNKQGLPAVMFLSSLPLGSSIPTGLISTKHPLLSGIVTLET